MSGLSVALWLLLVLWDLVIAYVFVDVRRVMANNNAAIARLLGRDVFGITDRGVLINRVLLVLLLVVSNWAVLRFCLGWG